MDLSTFRNHVRFLSGDGAYSNMIQRERLVDRPGNTINGINTVFYLNNRRIVDATLYDEANNVIPSASYTLDTATGKITFTTPPTNPEICTDYYFQFLDDTELNQTISGAAASAGFNPDSVDSGSLDYAAAYALSYVYMSIASKAASYYTISAAGKQVSKGEIFNHYHALAGVTLRQAQELRKDFYQDRGQRDIPSDATTASSWVQPYILDGGGG
jgi:hypothetical protein